jgi:hypothetical protein
MRWMLAFALVPLSFAADAAWDGTGPGRGLTGNNTGGIIQWTPDIAPFYRDIAVAHCARWYRIAEITSVHPRYGDYIGFRCIVDRRYDPRKERLYGAFP